MKMLFGSKMSYLASYHAFYSFTKAIKVDFKYKAIWKGNGKMFFFFLLSIILKNSRCHVFTFCTDQSVDINGDIICGTSQHIKAPLTISLW